MEVISHKRHKEEIIFENILLELVLELEDFKTFLPSENLNYLKTYILKTIILNYYCININNIKILLMHYPRAFFLNALCLATLLTIANAMDQFKINNNDKDDDVNDVASILTTFGAVPERFRRATKECEVDCSKTKRKPVCGTDRQIYRHKCELKRIRRCEGRRVRAVPMGFCTGQFSFILFAFLYFLFVVYRKREM